MRQKAKEHNQRKREAVLKSRKERYQDNREAVLESRKERYQDNREAVLESRKERYQDNREAVLESRKERYQDNQEAELKMMKQHYQDNREALLESRKERYQDNREAELESRKEYHKRNRESRKENLAARREEKRARIQGTRVNFINTNSHHHIAMSPGEGVDRHFERHQDCPEANTVLNHITTYRNHYTGNPEDPQEYMELRDQIRAQFITPEKQKEVAEKFLLSQGRGCSWAGEGGKKMFVEGKSRDAPILGCACCGYRVKDCNNSYTKVPLSELQILRLNEVETEEHLQRIKDYNVDLPSNNAGQLKTYNLWKAWSIWPQKCPDVENDESIDYYFLHPELVESLHDDCNKSNSNRENCQLVQDRHCAWLCPSCHKDIQKGDIPSNSIRAGIDYGSYHRIGLEPLTLIERHIISRVRHYSQVVKIESNSGRQREHTQCCIKGCCIAFDHDSPRVCANILSKETMTQDICVHFVGPEGQHDNLLRTTRHIKPTHLFGRAFTVYQWMKTLIMINPRYKYDGELPSFFDFKKTIARCCRLSY